MEQVRRECATVIPDDFDYSELKCISEETKEKFQHWRPQNLAAATRFCDLISLTAIFCNLMSNQ